MREWTWLLSIPACLGVAAPVGILTVELLLVGIHFSKALSGLVIVTSLETDHS